VRRSLARPTAGFLLAPFLALASALAPTHAHESSSPHAHALVHSHFAPHDIGAAHDHDGTEIEPDDERVVWMDNPICFALPYQLEPPLTLVVDVFEAIPATGFWSVTAIDDTAPPHGPPRRVSPVRGPPFLPLLT
jgi:hypothetical protein